MAKIIKYKVFSHEVNHGTLLEPDIERILLDVEISCPTQESFDANYPIAEKEAVGSIQVEGEFDEIDMTPTQLDLIEAQVTYTAMMTDTLLEV